MQYAINIDNFIESTRDIVYLREVDRIMIVRPNKIQHLNETAFKMMSHLYGDKNNDSSLIIDHLAQEYRISKNIIYTDVIKLLKSVEAIMKENYGQACMVTTIPFDPSKITYPVLSEIALTYNCQNKCDFCYASSPHRGNELQEMNTDEVKTIIKKIKEQAHVPTISFTGGEPTLRKDLPELIKYASSLGMRTNLITNGIQCADKNFVNELKQSGLHSAQVSLESHDKTVHNRIVNNSSAYASVIQGIHNLKNINIHTHTNTTICHNNKDCLIPLVNFLKDEFKAEYLSMNMIIATGIARDNNNIELSYSTIKSIIEPVIDHCESKEIKFVWYSPTPYCMFNPIDYNLGSKSCACISGLLSVNPTGEVLPCSSYDKGVGNLLNNSFDFIWNSDEAIYYREKRYQPPVCKGCEFDVMCSGACPLYWEHKGSFEEIEMVRKKKPWIKNMIWHIEKKMRVSTQGIKGINN